MKYALFCLVLLFPETLFATPARWVDGQIKFPVAQIGAHIIWDQAERDAILASTPTAPVVAVLSTVQEQALSAGFKFSNFSEYEDRLNQGNAGLVDLLNQTFAELTRLQAVQADNIKLDLSVQITALQGKYASLKALVK